MRNSSGHSRKLVSIDYLAELLEQLDPNMGHGDWIKVLMAVCHETGGSDEGFNLVDNWSSGGDTYPGTPKLYKQWKYLKPDHEPAVTVGTLKWMAKNSR